MSLDFLFAPVEYLDETVSHLFEARRCRSPCCSPRCSGCVMRPTPIT